TASMREDLAYALIRMNLSHIRSQVSDFEPRHLWVPFAGSGTLGFEAIAAMVGLRLFHFARPLAMESFKCLAAKSLEHSRKVSAIQDPLPKVTLIENDAETARALAANVDEFVRQIPAATGCLELVEGDVFETAAIPATPVYAPLNPPYGKRI